MSIKYIGDSHKASAGELRTTHAKVLAQNACPFIIAKVQAVDQYEEVFGKTMPFSTAWVTLELFDAGSDIQRRRIPKQEKRGGLDLAKARKDALDLAMNAAIKEILHELE